MRNTLRYLQRCTHSIFVVAILVQFGSATLDDLFTRCYGEYGCFSNAGKFGGLARPLNDFPEDSDVIRPNLNLYTRENPTTSDLLNVDDVSGIGSTHFNYSLPTKMFIHGYLGNGEEGDWYNNMRQEFLILDKFNIIDVDWRVGALGTYKQAVANARLIGAMLANFFQLLQASGYQTQKVHIQCSTISQNPPMTGMRFYLIPVAVTQSSYLANAIIEE